ncbi:hypothetical protein, partial [Thiolapillus sp.]|uniref:hypothetical protein n=1 Tax=Thiolapillus sp. TaxID=2017437 RepID=UPI003AF51729
MKNRCAIARAFVAKAVYNMPTTEILMDRLKQACRYLVIDFGTSKSPKSTRQRDNHYCPGRPASVPLRQHPRTLDAGFAALPQMTGRDFSYAYFVFPLRYRTPDKQCGPGRYRGLTAFASLSMAVSVGQQTSQALRLGEGDCYSQPIDLFQSLCGICRQPACRKSA